MPASNPALFILDFDSTITVNDTISPLFSQAVAFQTRAGKGEAASQALKVILSEYARDLEAFEHSNSWKERKKRGFRNVSDMVAYQRALKEVETRSFERVGKRRIFEAIGKDGFEGLGREAAQRGDVVIRNGFEE